MTILGFQACTGMLPFFSHYGVITMMAPVFSAFDHLTYQSLICKYLADTLCTPTRPWFTQNGVSISDHLWLSVGINEAHEIEDLPKKSVVHPAKDYLCRITYYIPYCAKCIDNLKQ